MVFLYMCIFSGGWFTVSLGMFDVFLGRSLIGLGKFHGVFRGFLNDFWRVFNDFRRCRIVLGYFHIFSLGRFSMLSLARFSMVCLRGFQCCPHMFRLYNCGNL